MSFGWLKSNERGATRRAFLGSTGTVVALPLLESLLPREARAQATMAPRRVLYYYVPDGMHMPSWTPTTAGANYTTPVIQQPLEKAMLKSDYMVVTGMVNQPAKPASAGDHAAGTSGFITCATALKSASVSMLGISVDQLAAASIGKNTRVPYVALGTEGGALAGTCDSGYGCPYVRAISWSGVSTPVSKITDPKVAFDLIFQGVDPNATVTDQKRRTARRQSVLDAAVAQAMSLQKRLGATDRHKLDEYLTSVRETEREILNVPAAGSCKGAVAPGATPDLETLVHAMSDIMVLAMQCDVSRIFTFMMGNAGGQHVYSNLGITRGHHDISHHGGNAANFAMLEKIDTYEIQLLEYLLTKMKNTLDGDSNLLFNSTVYYSSEISDGDRHNHDNMPVIIAGHGGGMWATGQHYSLPTTTKVSNMLVGTLRTMGINDAKLGDSTGPVMDVFKA